MTAINLFLVLRATPSDGRALLAMPENHVTHNDALSVIDAVAVTPGSCLTNIEKPVLWRLAAIRRLEGLLDIDRLPPTVPHNVSRGRRRHGRLKKSLSYEALDGRSNSLAALYYPTALDKHGPYSAIVLMLDPGYEPSIETLGELAPDTVLVVAQHATGNPRTGGRTTFSRQDVRKQARELLEHGDSLVGRRVRDGLRLLMVLKQLDSIDERRIAVVGVGRSAPVALALGAIDGDVAATALGEVPQEDEDFELSVIPASSMYFSGLDLAALIVPRPILVSSSGFPDVSYLDRLYDATAMDVMPDVVDDGDPDAFLREACQWARGLFRERSSADGTAASQPFEEELSESF